jgi:N-acylglucosamine 2-epimerase
LIGFAEYAKAADDEDALKMTREIYKKIVSLYDAPKPNDPRRMEIHVAPMLLLSTTQTIRDIDVENKAYYNDVAKKIYSDINRLFVKRDRKLLLENVGSNGEIFEDIAQGRTVNVGHAIEEAWFMITEGMYQNDSKMINDSIQILDWMLEIGWDNEFGGFFSYLDMNGMPPHEVIWDLKYWWPHNEAMYALLLAHHLTGDTKYEQWYEKVHEWAFKHFKDDEYGDWYGYLHRDGSVLLPIKGSEWKGSFHTSRMFMYGLELLGKMKQQ